MKENWKENCNDVIKGIALTPKTSLDAMSGEVRSCNAIICIALNFEILILYSFKCEVYIGTEGGKKLLNYFIL